MNKALEEMWPGPRAAELTLSFEVNEISPEILTSRICEGGKWEIGFGNTFYEDGSPVKPGETITLERAYALKAMALRRNWLPVRDALTFVPTQSQVDALAIAAYNLGGEAVAKSHLMEQANAGRWEDAAAAFSNLIGATSPGPSDREIAKGWVPKGMKWGEFPDGKGRMVKRWLGPDGQPCNYFRRLRGLLRRRHAEACLFLNCDWTEATKDDAIALRTERFWNPTKARWEDRVVEKTEFTSVYAVARKYPLANVPINSAPDAPVAPAPTIPVEVAPLPEIVNLPGGITLPTGGATYPEPAPEPAPKVETPVTPPATKSPPSTAQLPYGSVEPIKDPKDMLASKRFWGLLIMVFSRFSFLGLSTQTWAGQIVGDPILLDAAAAGLAMGALFVVDAGGQMLHWYGKRDAKAFLK